MESVHENPKSDTGEGLFRLFGDISQTIFGRKLESEEILLGVLILLLLTNHKRDKAPQKNEGSLLNMDGIKGILGKLGDKDILAIMLLYIMW